MRRVESLIPRQPLSKKAMGTAVELASTWLRQGIITTHKGVCMVYMDWQHLNRFTLSEVFIEGQSIRYCMCLGTLLLSLLMLLVGVQIC